MIHDLRKNGIGRADERTHVRKAAGIVAMTALRNYGMTQTGIAKYLGTTQAMVSNTVNGVTTPSLRTLAKLATLTSTLGIKLPEITQWREL